jgi:hypothetical protein
MTLRGVLATETLAPCDSTSFLAQPQSWSLLCLVNSFAIEEAMILSPERMFSACTSRRFMYSFQKPLFTCQISDPEDLQRVYLYFMLDRVKHVHIFRNPPFKVNTIMDFVAQISY